MTEPATRASREIQHGRRLAAIDPDDVWGWGSPAGKLRADRRAHQIMSGAQLAPGKRVLEIGCGTGLFTQRFAASGATIIAVDLSPELLARARARNLPPNVTLLEKRFEECDVDGLFDAVIGSSILHHLEVEESLGKVFHLLKPDGRLSFAEPNMLNPQIMVQKNIPWIKERLGDSPDERAFIRFSLERLLRDIGFADIEIAPFDWLHPSTPSPIIPAVRAIGRILEQLPVVREFAGSLSIHARRP